MTNHDIIMLLFAMLLTADIIKYRVYSGVLRTSIESMQVGIACALIVYGGMGAL